MPQPIINLEIVALLAALVAAGWALYDIFTI